MVLPIYASLERLDLRLVEAGADLYASAASTFRHVTLPLSMPGVVVRDAARRSSRRLATT